MENSKTPISTHRHIVVLVDYSHSNPQGDPDSGNCPRMDDETSIGYITSQGMKRKIRDWLSLENHPIYIARRACLERLIKEVQDSLGIKPTEKVVTVEASEGEASEEVEKKGKKGKGKSKPPAKKANLNNNEDRDRFVRAVCDRYIDVRMFGAVFASEATPCRGPVQIGMATSIDPITPVSTSITRVAVATEQEAAKQGELNRTMGTSWHIPYGLYRFHIYINPHDARLTGFSEEDYQLLLRALVGMFDNDKSQARTSTCVREIHEFVHKLGESRNAAFGEPLLETIKVVKKEGVEVPRSFDDYVVEVPVEVHDNPDFTYRQLIKKLKWTYQEAEAV